MAADAPLEKQGLRNRKPVAFSKKFKPRFWEDSDSRCAVVRTLRKRYALVRAHCGGEESVQRDMLCQRVVFLSAILETQEVLAAEGKGLELGSYIQAVNGLTGLLKTLGLDKRVKNVTDLRAYLNQKGQAG